MVWLVEADCVLDINLSLLRNYLLTPAQHFSPGSLATTSGVPAIILCRPPSQVASSASPGLEWSDQRIPRPLCPFSRPWPAWTVQAEHGAAERSDRHQHRAPGSPALHQLQRPGASLHLRRGRRALRPWGLRHRVWWWVWILFISDSDRMSSVWSKYLYRRG